MRSEHQEIPHLALLGHITLNSILEPPSESWLVVRDPALPGPEKIWRDVRIPPEELRYLHPVALIEHWREGWEQRDATLGSGRPEIGGRTPATSCPTEDGADWRIPYTPKFLAAWFEDVRVPGWKGRSPPSAADCYAEAQKYFKDPIPRDPFREIRKGSTPPDWRKPGPRGPR